MTKNWLNMGLRPRAVTRDLEWGIEVPINNQEWGDKRIYVWFEAVQGYLSCAKIWSERYAQDILTVIPLGRIGGLINQVNLSNISTSWARTTFHSTQ